MFCFKLQDLSWHITLNLLGEWIEEFIEIFTTHSIIKVFILNIVALWLSMPIILSCKQRSYCLNAF